MPGFILLQLNPHNWVLNRKMSESLIQGCALPPTGAFLLHHDIVNTDHSRQGKQIEPGVTKDGPKQTFMKCW